MFTKNSPNEIELEGRIKFADEHVHHDHGSDEHGDENLENEDSGTSTTVVSIATMFSIIFYLY